MSAIDWPGLLRAGLHGLGLEPKVFWQLTPIELKIMLGVDAKAAPLTRARLSELSAAFPDIPKDIENGADRGLAGSGGRT